MVGDDGHPYSCSARTKCDVSMSGLLNAFWMVAFSSSLSPMYHCRHLQACVFCLGLLISSSSLAALRFMSALSQSTLVMWLLVRM